MLRLKVAKFFLKVAQIFPKVAQNVSKAVFIWNGMFFKITQKSLHSWTTFVTKNSPRTLKNRPIWSHLLQKAKYREQNIYASGHTAEDVASRML